MSTPPSAGPDAVFILSVSSDIGEHLALDYLGRGLRVAGTYRREPPPSLAGHAGFAGFRCDITAPGCGRDLAAFLHARNFHWDIFVSCVGQLAPVGDFFENDFAEWAQSVETNGVAQLRALHAIHPFRRADRVCHVVFFAGGGTNNPFRSYSAYCLGKIGLIKMCELLDDENPDLNVFIVGTGWVRTKIHAQTLAAGSRAGGNFDRTRAFLYGNEAGTARDDIAAMIRWGVAQGRPVAGGRNFSVVHDQWAEAGAGLAAALAANPDKFKLRRHGNNGTRLARL